MNKGSHPVTYQTEFMKIFDQVLQSSRVNIQIPVSGLGGIASKLEILLCGKCDLAATNEAVNMSYNNDVTDANYRYGQHRSSSGSHASVNADGRRIGLFSGATSTRGNAPAICMATILDPFSVFFEKTAYSNNGVRFDSDAEIWHFAHHWESVAPIELITLAPATSNFVRGTRCTVWQYL